MHKLQDINGRTYQYDRSSGAIVYGEVYDSAGIPLPYDTALQRRL